MGIFSFFSNSSNSERTLSEEEYLAYKKYLEDKNTLRRRKQYGKEINTNKIASHLRKVNQLDFEKIRFISEKNK